MSDAGTIEPKQGRLTRIETTEDNTVGCQGIYGDEFPEGERPSCGGYDDFAKEIKKGALWIASKAKRKSEAEPQA